eukprot:6820775-Pyramimonas_sp.AAC.1
MSRFVGACVVREITCSDSMRDLTPTTVAPHILHHANHSSERWNMMRSKGVEGDKGAEERREERGVGGRRGRKRMRR